MFVPTVFGRDSTRARNQKPIDAVSKPWTNYANGMTSGHVADSDGGLRRYLTTETGLYVFVDSEETGEWITNNNSLILGRANFMPRGPFNHLGDCDFDEKSQTLWVPVEGGCDPELFAFGPGLDHRYSLAVEQKFCSWCAVHDGLVFTSDFSTNLVIGYECKYGMSAADPVYKIKLPERLERIQGGTFDKSGRLILSVDSSDRPEIVVVNFNDDDTGTFHQRIPVDRKAFTPLDDAVNALAGEEVSRNLEMQGIHYEGGTLTLMLSAKHWLKNDGLRLLHYTEIEESFE